MSMKRREFLRNGIYAALGGAGLYTALGNLRLVEAATRVRSASELSDYKALVCVFLLGGNDSMNTIIPYDDAAYQNYRSARATLAVPRDSLLALSPLQGGGASDGVRYAIQACTSPTDSVGTSGLRQLFDAGKVAIVSNVGTLIRPVTKSDYLAGRAELPPQLFSHNDQQAYWQVSSTQSAGTGWGGRIADMLYTANPGAFIPTSTSLNFESVFLRGLRDHQYVIGNAGARQFNYLEWDASVRNAYLALHAEDQASPFERSFAASFRRARTNASTVDTALSGSSPLATQFPDNELGVQLKMVARMIQVRAALGLKRQVFFVSLGGFDHHDGLLEQHPRLLARLSQSLKAFYDATVEMGVAEQTTTFTASDFGRTLSSNGDGSDHGWGGHHFVMGGAVRGGRFVGRMPELRNGGPDDVEAGRMIPTLSVDQYAATLARWMGVGASEMDLVFPNLGNFALRDLGFLPS